MAPITYHLVSLPQEAGEAQANGFLDALRVLPESDKPLWLGRCHHWIHEPYLSVDALTGTSTSLKKWDYLLVSKSNASGSLDLPSGIDALLSEKWSISLEVTDDLIDGLTDRKTRLASEKGPELPSGWSADNHDALDQSEPPKDLVTSLGTKAPTLGNSKKDSKIDIKTFVRTFGTSTGHTSSPIAMFNLLSFLPGQITEYFKYVGAFQEVLGPATGGQPLFFGFDLKEWSTKAQDEGRGEGVWEGAALIWYPSIWHFGQMLGDEKYAKLDRDFKKDVVRDNPILCCTEVNLN